METPIYFVGIDFGHGETSVSRVPGTNGQKVSRIPLRISKDFSDHKIFSAICQNENGEWQFVWSKDDLKRPQVMEGFKGQIRKLSVPKRDALREFAKLVFKAILQNDSDLKYDPKTGKANFVICIANPSEWRRQSTEIPQEYLKFFQQEAGIKPIAMCINESDAAFYTKFGDYKSTDQVFVIDLGSSTIDFTTYNNTVLNPECCWGHNLGAHLVEDKLVEFGYSEAEEHEENSQNMIQVADWRRQHNLGPAEPALSLAARFAKESYFTRAQNGSTMYELDVKMRELIPNWPKKSQPAFSITIESDDVNNVIKDYIHDLELALSNAAKKLKSYGISPTKVLLSGGASRMTFVKDLTIKAFPNAEIIRDNFPEWVVSDGAARYAQVHAKAIQERNKLQNEFCSWAKANLDDKLCSTAVDTFNSVLRDSLRNKLQTVYSSSSIDGSLYDFERITRDHLESITKSYDFKSKADKNFTAVVDEYIKSKLESIIYSSYGKKVNITESFISPGDTFYNIGVGTDFLYDLIGKIADGICNNIFEGVSDLDWNKSRSYDQRQQLINALVSNIDYDTFSHNIDLDVFISQAVGKIDKILRDNGLFQISE